MRVQTFANPNGIEPRLLCQSVGVCVSLLFEKEKRERERGMHTHNVAMNSKRSFYWFIFPRMLPALNNNVPLVMTGVVTP